MEIYTISTTYHLKWRHKILKHYALSECNVLINTKTNRVVLLTLNGYSKGYWIGKKFITSLKPHFELITNKTKIPF